MPSAQVGSLVRVWTDVGARKPAALLAKVIEKDGVILTIRYLSESDDHIWRYEEDTYEIDDDAIAEYTKAASEEDLGFVKHDDGFIKMDADEDYVPSDEEESSDPDEDEDDDEDEEDEDLDEDLDEFEEDEESESEENIDEE
jgi:hypothetical protein